MNAEDVRKDSKYCKRSMRITPIFGVPNVKPKGRRGFYPFLVQALSNLLTDVQPDPPEQFIKGVGHLQGFDLCNKRIITRYWDSIEMLQKMK
jgi:hypothetical protein